MLPDDKIKETGQLMNMSSLFCCFFTFQQISTWLAFYRRHASRMTLWERSERSLFGALLQ